MKEEGGARSGADVLRVAVREKRSREDGVCVEKAHVAVAVSGKPHETRIAERQSTSVCGVLGESREVHVYERCTLSRRTCSRGARPELGAVVPWSTRSREVATPFFFFYLGDV